MLLCSLPALEQPQAGVEPFVGEKPSMVPSLDDLPVVKHQDLVSANNGAEPVSDGDCGSTFEKNG